MMRANQPLISNCCLCRLCYNAAARCQSASHRYRDFQRHSPQNHPRHAVNTSLGLGGKCPQNPRNGYWTYEADDTNGVIESFLALDLFSLTFSALTVLVGRQEGIRPVKTEWWGAGVVVCLERGADLHTAQLMLLPLTVSCFLSLIHI